MFDFPSSPASGTIVSGPNGAAWRWDGTKWLASQSGAQTIVVSDTPPPNATPGTLWWDSVGGQMYLRFQDPNSTAWVPASSLAGSQGVFIGDTPPTTPAPGVMWWDSTGAQLYVRYRDPSGPDQWVQANSLTADMSAAVAQSQGNTGRNLIGNALFQVQQRGVGPFTLNGSGPVYSGYTADRWFMSPSGAGSTQTGSIITLTDTDRAQIGDEAARYALRCAFVGSSGSTDMVGAQHRMEDPYRVSGKTVIVSFWARATVAGIRLGFNTCVYFGSTAYQSPTAALVTLTTTWQRYSAVFTNISSSGYANPQNHYLQLNYSSGSFFGSSGVFGATGVQSGTVDLWGCQMEIAAAGQTQPTQLEKIDAALDLIRCQRFYQTYSPPPLRGGAQGATAAATRMGMVLPVPMRVTPTLSLVQALPVWNGVSTTTITSFSANYTTAFAIEVEGVIPVAWGTVSGTVLPAMVYLASNPTGQLTLSADL